MPIRSASGSRALPLFLFKGTKLPFRAVLKFGCVTTQAPIPWLPSGATAVTREENGGIDINFFLELAYTFVDDPLNANGEIVFNL